MMFRSRGMVDDGGSEAEGLIWLAVTKDNRTGRSVDMSRCNTRTKSHTPHQPHHHHDVRSYHPMGSSLRHRGRCIHSIKSPSYYQACCVFFFIVSPPSRAPILCQS